MKVQKIYVCITLMFELSLCNENAASPFVNSFISIEIHIIGDGWCMLFILRESLRFYFNKPEILRLCNVNHQKKQIQQRTSQIFISIHSIMYEKGRENK